MAIAGSVLLAVSAAQAGQFKTLNTAGVAAGGSLAGYSSPQNTNQAMELETYEFVTSSAGGTYYCQVLYNGVGRTMNVSLVGVNGVVISSCSAASAGACNTSTSTSLAGNTKFQCVYATGYGSPITPGVDTFYEWGVHH
jgi:hypothetical protein